MGGIGFRDDRGRAVRHRAGMSLRTLTLDKPEKSNALSAAAAEELLAAQLRKT